jgi:hypothetical protein
VNGCSGTLAASTDACREKAGGCGWGVVLPQLTSCSCTVLCGVCCREIIPMLKKMLVASGNPAQQQQQLQQQSEQHA